MVEAVKDPDTRYTNSPEIAALTACIDEHLQEMDLSDRETQREAGKLIRQEVKGFLATHGQKLLAVINLWNDFYIITKTSTLHSKSDNDELPLSSRDWFEQKDNIINALAEASRLAKFIRRFHG